MKVDLQVRGLLFDMDGVLMSSIGSVERSWQRYAESRGLDPEHAIHLAHGRRAIETVRALRPDLDDATELRYIEDLEVEDNEGLVVLPGVKELLAELPEGSWAVVTSATERLARSRMAHAGIKIPKYFVTAETVRRGKPHPEPYCHGAALLGAEPADCLVVEDAPAGVGSGKAAGCPVLAVLTTYPAETLMEADWRVPTWPEFARPPIHQTGFACNLMRQTDYERLGIRTIDRRVQANIHKFGGFPPPSVGVSWRHQQLFGHRKALRWTSFLPGVRAIRCTDRIPIPRLAV